MNRRTLLGSALAALALPLRRVFHQHEWVEDVRRPVYRCACGATEDKALRSALGRCTFRPDCEAPKGSFCAQCIKTGNWTNRVEAYKPDAPFEYPQPHRFVHQFDLADLYSSHGIHPPPTLRVHRRRHRRRSRARSQRRR